MQETMAKMRAVAPLRLTIKLVSNSNEDFVLHTSVSKVTNLCYNTILPRPGAVALMRSPGEGEVPSGEAGRLSARLLTSPERRYLLADLLLLLPGRLHLHFLRVHHAAKQVSNARRGAEGACRPVGPGKWPDAVCPCMRVLCMLLCLNNGVLRRANQKVRRGRVAERG